MGNKLQPTLTGLLFAVILLLVACGGIKSAPSNTSSLVVTTTSLPDATEAQNYTAAVSATGGRTPYQWSLSPNSGPLPTGVSLNSQGVISGVPTESGTFPIIIRVTDSARPADTAPTALVLDVRAASRPLAVATTELPDATAAQSYSASLSAGGGTPPYTWHLTSGSSPLPIGLVLSVGGTISGTTSEVGEHAVTVQVSDTAGATAAGSLALNVTSATGVTYYVDTKAGNDGNSGTRQDAPWKTLAKVSATQFSPGTAILLKRGAMWREQITVPSSGAADNPIYFGAYGSGPNPVINGADRVTGWTLYSAAIYRALIPWAPLHVWQDAALLRSVPNLVALTAAGEWFYDSGSSQLYVWTASGDSPSLHTMEADRRLRGVDIAQRSYITLSDLTLVNSTSYLIGVWNAANISVLNCQFKNSSHVAVDVNAVSPNFLIDHSSYSVDPGYSGSGFVSMHATGADQPTVSNNTVGDSRGQVAIFFNDINNGKAYGNTISGHGIAIATNATTHNVSGIQLYNNFISACDNSLGDGECIEFTGNKSPIYTVTGSIYRNFVKGGPHTFSGIDGWHAMNSAIYDNIVLNTQSYGMEWTAGSTGNVFYHNTIVNTPVAAVAIYPGSGGTESSSGRIMNTIIAGAAVGISSDPASSVSEDYNLLFNVTQPRSDTITPGANTFLADPLFASGSPQQPGDVKLQSNSPAIGSGKNLGAPYNLIFDPKAPTWPFATVDQNQLNSGWERGAFGFR